jgi:tRNA A-37 threonylcarbamoyl transferase component Bud32
LDLPDSYVASDEGRVLLLVEERARLASLGLDRLETAMTAGELLRATPHKAIARLPGLYVKRYDYDRREVFLKAAIKANFPVFSGRRELENALALRAAGLPAPRPLACGEEKRGWRKRSFVVLEEVPGVALERIEPPAGRERRELVLAVARLVRRLHEAGFAHRDLYLANIIKEAEKLGIVDLERVRGGGVSERARRKDLAALDYSAVRWSATDRVRFLREYLGVRRLGEAGKALAKRVRAKARVMARKGSKK